MITPPPQPRRLLVRGVNWLGDAVMTTPALLRLREAHPRAHIAMLTRDTLAELWQHHPAVDEVIPFTRKESFLAIGKGLRAGQFDTALVLPNSTRSALEVWWARIPVRIGYKSVNRRLMLTHNVPRPANPHEMRKRTVREIRGLITTPPEDARAIPPAAHHLHHYLHLAAALGASPEPVAPRLEISFDETESAARKFGLPVHEGTKLIGLNAGAEYGPAKRWPVANFVAAARNLQMRVPARFVLFGGPGDITSVNELAESLTQAATPDGRANGTVFYNLAGQTSLRELCAVLKCCHVLLTNDTGPMHLAAAVGTPVVVPFGSTSPELTGPGLPGERRHALIKSTAPCSPCFLRECPIDFRCMQGISVGQVVNAAMRHLEAE